MEKPKLNCQALSQFSNFRTGFSVLAIASEMGKKELIN